MHGLSTFYGIFTITALLTVCQNLRNFRRKKMVFFTRGPPWGIWKILTNYDILSEVNQQIPNATPKITGYVTLLFSGKKGIVLRNFFRGNFMYISQKCITLFILTFEPFFYLQKERIIFFRRDYAL